MIEVKSTWIKQDNGVWCWLHELYEDGKKIKGVRSEHEWDVVGQRFYDEFREIVNE